jgi:hypothetical protein
LSDIRANTISDAAGTGPITLTGQSAAKAFVTFDPSAVPQSSLNVSSGTDRGTGLCTINYTSNFSDAEYTTTSHIQDGGGENDTRMLTTSNDSGSYTSSLIKVYAGYHSASTNGAIILDDVTRGYLIAHGDLA